MKINYSLTRAFYKKHNFPENVFGWIFDFLKAFIFSFIIFIGISLAWGYKPIMIAGSSMHPAIKFYDVILIKKVPQEEIIVGDVITFTNVKGVMPVTHRVVGIDPVTGGFYTKGESPTAAIDNPDKPLPYANIDGKVIFRIPTYFIFQYLIFPYNDVTFICLIGFIYLVYNSGKIRETDFKKIIE